MQILTKKPIKNDRFLFLIKSSGGNLPLTNFNDKLRYPRTTGEATSLSIIAEIGEGRAYSCPHTITKFGVGVNAKALFHPPQNKL